MPVAGFGSTGGAGRKRDLLQCAVIGAKLAPSSRKLADLEHVGHDRGRLRPRQLPRLVCGHRVLDLVDEIRERLRAPGPDEIGAGKRRCDAALQRCTVARGAALLIDALATRRLARRCRRHRSTSAPAAPEQPGRRVRRSTPGRQRERRHISVSPPRELLETHRAPRRHTKRQQGETLAFLSPSRP